MVEIAGNDIQSHVFGKSSSLEARQKFCRVCAYQYLFLCKDLAVLVIRTRRKQSLHVVIERIEQICEPMFILTPYQVESQNTLVVVIPKAAAGKVLENLKACNAVEATELHENPPATALFPIKLDDHRCVIHGESVHEALFVGVYGYTASSIVKTMF